MGKIFVGDKCKVCNKEIETVYFCSYEHGPMCSVECAVECTNEDNYKYAERG